MGSRFVSGIALSACLVLFACGESTRNVCAEGEQLDCTCADGEPSQRICLEGGLGFSSCIGCRKDGGVEVPPIEEDLLEPVLDNDDAGPPKDLAGADLKPVGCTAATCDGCCQGNNCVPAAMQSDTQCHVGSLTACQACPAGFSCVADQACAKQAATCDAASCPSGCCDGDVCLSADPTHCGNAGAACATCARGTLCTSGACQNNLDPDALFDVVITSVETESTTASGQPWDTNLTAADPKVCFIDGSTVLACTKECTDSISCNYSAADGILSRGSNSPDFDDALAGAWPFYGSELAAGIPFRVWDMDNVPLHRYDTMASGTMFKITKLQTQYSILPFQRVKSLKFTIKPL